MSNITDYSLPLIEKYRPTTLDQVVGNTDCIDRLKIIAKDGNLPNLILTGPPGTGKTTSILCLANQLFNFDSNLVKEAFLELNASDDRGIEVVRTRIKNFAQKKINLLANKHKIVLLDEADSMTTAAQQALRRTIELFSHSTRFVFSCNTSSKIIEPIQSRCAILRFTTLKDEEVLYRINQILKKENIEAYTEDGLSALVWTAEGDLRNAINALQSCYSGFGSITAENVLKVVDSPSPIAARTILEHCLENNIDEALKEMTTLHIRGYSSIDIVNTLFKVCKSYTNTDNIKHKDMNDFLKISFIKQIGLYHMRISDGIDSQLQLAGLISSLCRVSLEMKNRK